MLYKYLCTIVYSHQVIRKCWSELSESRSKEKARELKDLIDKHMELEEKFYERNHVNEKISKHREIINHFYQLVEMAEINYFDWITAIEHFGTIIEFHIKNEEKLFLEVMKQNDEGEDSRKDIRSTC